jgi:hypothetical protein
VAFAFDPNRKRQLIDKADERFDAHLAKLKRQKEKERK